MTDDATSGDRGLPLVRAWFASHTRLSPELIALPAFEESVRTRMREIRSAGDADYATLLDADPAEAAAAHALVAVPETWLFRGRTSFELLRERLAEPRRRAGSPIQPPAQRLLSAGSATGAEACSLVLTAVAAGWSLETIHVDAIDLNGVALGVGRVGRYGSLMLREGLPTWTPPLVRPIGEGIEIDRAVVDRIRFIEADLFSWTPDEGVRYAVVFCRNLLIYLARAARAQLATRLLSWLAPDGLLVVGHADAIGWSTEELVSAGPPGAFAYERRTSRTSGTRGTRQPAASSGRTHRAEGARRATAAPRIPPIPRRLAPEPLPDVDTAVALLAVERVTEAISVLEGLLRRRPDSIEALLLLGETRLARAERAEAEAAFTKVVFLEPAHERALVRLAELCDAAGRSEAADRYRDRALRAHLAERGDGDLTA